MNLRAWTEGKRIGLVANPKAGKAEDQLDATLAALVGCLGGARVAAVRGTREADAAAGLGGACTLVSGGGRAGAAAERLLDAGVDAVVGVGGDGTLRDVAEALVRRGGDARLIGIGAGSSNVGALVSATAAQVQELFEADVEEVWVHALDVAIGGEPVGLAFHDVAFSNTYFGTRAGARIDLDAVAALAREDRAATPRSVCGRSSWVAKNGRRILSGGEIEGGQIVASPLNDVESCRGRAVGGFLCWGPYLGCAGLLAVASTVMIRTQLDRGDLEAAEPLRLWHVGFSPDDIVEVGGLDGGAVVVDGTPKRALDRNVAVALTLREDAVAVVRAGERAGLSGNVG